MKFKKIKTITFNKTILATVVKALEENKLAVGDIVKCKSKSKGKGFCGVVYQGCKGGGASHGSHFHRKVGSVGLRDVPSKPGRRNPKKCGNELKSIKSMILAIEKDLITLKGSIPGAKKSIGKMEKKCQ